MSEMSKEERQAINEVLLDHLMQPDYVYSAEHVNSGFNDWFRLRYGRKPGKDPSFDREVAETYLSVMWHLWAKWHTYHKQNEEKLADLLAEPVPPNPAVQAVLDFTRVKMYPGKAGYKLSPPVKVENDDLDK